MISIKTYFTKILIAIIILLLTLIYTNYSLKNLRNYQKYYQNNNFKFYHGLNLTKKLFGSKNPIKEEGLISPVINNDSNYQSEPYLNGKLLTYQEDTVIKSYNSGIVVFLGDKEDYDHTIIIQGIDGIDIWYGNITDEAVKLYDYVEKNKIIGKPKNYKLYLKMEQNGNNIDIDNYLNEI